MKVHFVKAAAAAALFAVAGAASAATATGSIAVSGSVSSRCDVTTNGALTFPAFTPSQGAITTTSTIGVKCTNSTPYNIGLGAGSGTGATSTTRVAMKGGDKLEYQLFSDSGRTANWGNTVGTDTVGGTGSGYSTEKTHTVYGKISEQLDAVPGSYSDTVAITVTY